jgi:ESS family glutamate:Na+ symporter
MDYSAANPGVWNFIIQLGIIAGAVLVSQLLTAKVKFLRSLRMPIGVMAGFLILILKSFGLININVQLMEILVYHCIALGFIAMSLRTTKEGNEKKGDLTGPKSGALIVSTYLIQGIIGLVITITLAFTFMPDFFMAAGIILPMGFGQGPGQASNVGSTYENLGFVNGQSFGLAIAAAGYLCACTVGVIMINVLARKKKIDSKRVFTSDDPRVTVGNFQDNNEIPVSDSIDKLSVQIAFILAIYFITYLAMWGLTSAISAISAGLASTVNSLVWGFNFIIASVITIICKVLLKKANQKKIFRRQQQNNYLLSRISGFFFDIMIVAGISAIEIDKLSGLWVPFILLAVAGGVVTWLYLAFVCKKVYKDYYYEGLISMYGMLTGTISSGVLLLREIDPDYKTPASNNLVVGSSYAIVLAAPILVLIGLAAKSTAMCFLTLGLITVYFAALLLFILKAKQKKKGSDDTENVSDEANTAQ